MIEMTDIHTMTLDGGMACLDFVNAGYDEGDGMIRERMHDYGDLLVLARRCKVISSKQAADLSRAAKADPVRSAGIFRRARTVRTAMFDVFGGLAHERAGEIAIESLAILNRAFRQVNDTHAFLVAGGKLVWERESPDFPPDLVLPLHGFLQSARQLLLEKDQTLIRQCAGCDWLFLDETKNHRRKWCDMQTCGSQAKSKRYYERNKNRLHE